MEKISAAALRFSFDPNEKQYFQYLTNNSHGAIIELLGALDIRMASRYNQIPGFMTNYNRFVDRTEALGIAILANQIVKKHPRYDELYSEDLRKDDGTYTYAPYEEKK